jgi:hypothetical protein
MQFLIKIKKPLTQNKDRFMSIMNLKKIILASSLVLFNSLGQAHEEAEHKHAESDQEKVAQPNDHHAFVHPFISHMGMPDSPGEVSTRINSFERRTDGESSGTYGFHIEAGIFEKLGLHLRNDGVKTHENSELMLQYALLKSSSGLSGLSLIGEVEFPTGPTKEKTMGLFGISFAHQVATILAINSTIHYSPKKEGVEWEIAFVTPVTEKIFPVLEANGEVMKGGKTITNILGGLKFKIPNGHALGVAYQIGIPNHRDFNSQLIVQAELNF